MSLKILHTSIQCYSRLILKILNSIEFLYLFYNTVLVTAYLSIKYIINMKHAE